MGLINNPGWLFAWSRSNILGMPCYWLDWQMKCLCQILGTNLVHWWNLSYSLTCFLCLFHKIFELAWTRHSSNTMYEEDGKRSLAKRLVLSKQSQLWHKQQVDCDHAVSRAFWKLTRVVLGQGSRATISTWSCTWCHNIGLTCAYVCQCERMRAAIPAGESISQDNCEVW